MKTFIALLAIFGLVGHASAQAPHIPSCSQIRAQINAQAGVVAKPEVALLQLLSKRSDCRFSAPEIYRAAYGNKPLPKNERESRHPITASDDD